MIYGEGGELADGIDSGFAENVFAMGFHRVFREK